MIGVDVMADDREKFCERVVNNINDWKSQIRIMELSVQNLRRELKQLEAELRKAESELHRLMLPLPVVTPPSQQLRGSGSRSEQSKLPRALRRPFGVIGTTVVDAFDRVHKIGKAERTINQLRAQVRSVKSMIDRAERSIQEKERLIKQSQGSYTRHDCFALGFSHEVLNAR